jgi:hypothetical protein
LIKGLSFDQFLRESTKKSRKNPINTLRNQRRKREREKIWGYSLLIDHIVKVQKPNIKGLVSFG